jgi:uncharacterized protein (DUF362 family)
MSSERQLDRRRFVVTAAASGVGLGLAAAELVPQHALMRDRRPARSRVAVLTADRYSDALEQLLYDGLKLFNLAVKAKTILLKPNLVDYSADAAINTHPVLVGTAAVAFLRLGAAIVTVAEGPGHQRDTFLLLVESGLGDQLRDRGIRFVDLNRDDVLKCRVRRGYTGLDHLWLPRTVLSSDLIVSMPKVKTHHWAGVTLSMKNMFGVIPGSCYGWPKNVLHWKGIHESILDICATVPIHFVIADGIVAMEGNGPLHGRSRQLNTVVLADDAVAADFTCARLMGLNPMAVPHLREANYYLGNGSLRRIQQLASPLPRVFVPPEPA